MEQNYSFRLRTKDAFKLSRRQEKKTQNLSLWLNSKQSMLYQLIRIPIISVKILNF